MSKTQQRYSEDEGFSSYQPKTNTKSVVIMRSSNRAGRPSGGFSGGSFGSMRQSLALNPAVYTQMAGTGIADFRGNREKEKKDMQDCNERLATYIEKVRWLEAQNKKLEAEVEALRNRKQEDWRPIRDMFESELSQARKVIADLSAQKGVEEGKLAGLQDEIQSLRELIGQYETNAKDYVKKIDQLNSQVGEYEGEVTTLRMRCGTLEDELAKLRALLQKYKDENARLRADLDAETAAHIEQEVEAKTRAEEVEFLQDLLDKLQMTQQEPVTIKGLNLEDYFKGELRRSVQQIQQTFDDRMEQAQLEMEGRYQAQMNQLRSGNVRDSMEAEHSKAETKRLRDLLAERQARIAELESQLATMKAERDGMRMRLSEVEQELERLRLSSQRKEAELQEQIEALMAQLNELIDRKMSLELEIACYKKLLEGEENRTGLRQLVEQTIGVQSHGAAHLADIIGQSTMQSTTARTTVQRTSKGNICFHSVDPMGSKIIVENTSAANKGKHQNLRGWKVRKEVDGKVQFSEELPECLLDGGQNFILYSSGMKKDPQSLSDFEGIAKEYAFGVGNGVYKLIDGNGQEKATMTVKLQQ